MNRILAVLAADEARQRVVAELADEAAALLHDSVRVLAPGRVTAEAVLRELARPDTDLAVLAAAADPELCWDVVTRADKPVLVAPAAAAPTGLGRALLPLDGTPESTAAVERWFGVLDRAGVDVVVLHVFEPHTVPRYWDHAAHADVAWRRSFLQRHGMHGSAHLEVRSGLPMDTVGAVAVDEKADLVVLGWSQHPGPERARVVRGAIETGSVPVLLVPLAGDRAAAGA